MTTLSLDRDTLDMRRGACPALSAPMMTGDGLLVRVSLTQPITPTQLGELGRLSDRHGNGLLDISARGNLQIRGLSEASARELDADVRALDLPLSEGLAVETPPLAGLDTTELADPRPLAEAIRRGALDIAGLAPKMTVVVDGGGQLRLSDLLADIRLIAIETNDGIAWKLLLGGTEATARVFNVLRETQAVAETLGLLRQLAALGDKARGRDLAMHLPLNQSVTRTQTPFGLMSLADGYAAGIGPAFGQVQAKDLIALSEEAARLGIISVKPTFDHSLIAFGSLAACGAFQAFAGENGFVTRSDDPRNSIATCTGKPSCASAVIPTREMAATIATNCADLFDGSFRLHVTGCAKGCAHPQPSALALCGTADGVALIADGKAGDQAFASIAVAEIAPSLLRIVDLVRAERQKGENSAACLKRLGAQRLSAAVMTGRP